MPEATTLAHMLTPVKPVNESVRNLKPDNVPNTVRSDRADSVINGDNGSIPKKSASKKDQGANDFNKVLSRKIDGQKEQTPDEHSQENVAPAETAELNLTWHMSFSGSTQGNNPLESTNGKITSEQASAEISNPLENTDNIQLATNTGIMGETANPENQMNGQTSEQAQGTSAQPTVPKGELATAEKTTAEGELPVDEKQLHAQKPVMTERVTVSEGNNTEGKQVQGLEMTEQIRKQVSDGSDSEIRPVRIDRDKSIHPDLQPVLPGARQEQHGDFQSQSDNSGAVGRFQDETQDIKDPQGVPFEAETFHDEQDGIGKGFEIRNAQSMLHSAAPAQNASISALEAPARTGIHSDTPQMETVKPVDQILQHINSVSVSGPQQQIKLTLTPEHLGTIRITFNRVEDEVVGLLEVQKDQTRRQVEQSLPQLISAMQSSGVQVRRIDVVQWGTTQDGGEDGTAKESNYSTTDQFHDESPSNSSKSQTLEDVRSSEHGQRPTQLSEISEQEGPIYGADITENSLNMFI